VLKRRRAPIDVEAQRDSWILLIQMPLFSQRKGLKPLKSSLQLDAVDKPLRNLLWTCLCNCFFDYCYEDSGYGFPSHRSESVRRLINAIWCYHFKHPSDSLPRWNEAITAIRTYFLECKWNEIYDLLEFVAKNSETELPFKELSNSFLELENSAYRFVGNEIVEITSASEIQEIEQAGQSGIHGVEKHIATALSFLADRKNPDYRNCVKEAISAVETVCRSFAGGTTLSDALEELKKKVEIHPAFERSLHTLYGYTSDESGVRHSLLEASAISFSDAKFMLVTCSAFANYLIGKAAESGLKLKN
jgi:AbiJ N-terminal domain 4